MTYEPKTMKKGDDQKVVTSIDAEVALKFKGYKAVEGEASADATPATQTGAGDRPAQVDPDTSHVAGGHPFHPSNTADFTS